MTRRVTLVPVSDEMPEEIASGPERTEEIIGHLFALVDRLRAGFEATVARFDLSAPQAKALRYLAHAGPVPMRELAFGLHCDASNVTGIVDRLEQRGLVERRAAPSDRRVKSLVVTASGAALAHDVWSSVVNGTVTFVGLTDSEHTTLLMLLRQLDHGPGAGCWLSNDEMGHVVPAADGGDVVLPPDHRDGRG